MDKLFRVSDLIETLDVSEAVFPITLVFGDKKYLLVKSPNGRLMLNAHPDMKTGRIS